MANKRDQAALVPNRFPWLIRPLKESNGAARLWAKIYNPDQLSPTLKQSSRPRRRSTVEAEGRRFSAARARARARRGRRRRKRKRSRWTGSMGRDEMTIGKRVRKAGDICRPIYECI